MKKLAIITTHPIQYNAPFFAELSKEFDLLVFYTLADTSKGYYDKGFQKNIKWDTPLTQGYNFVVVKNIAKNPSTTNFFGIINPDLINHIKTFKPDAILVYGWRHYSHLRAMIYFKNKIPILFRGDSTLIDITNKLKLKLKTNFLKLIYHFVDYALYVGTYNKQYFLACGLKPHQLIFVPHSVDNNFFDDPSGTYTQQALQWRLELGIRPNDNVVMFVGKLQQKKNPQILIEVAKRLKNIKFIFVGDGHLRQKLFSENLQNVFHLPFQNQSSLPIVYRMADVVVLPSTYNETWGLVINEAMACSKPVLVSNKVGCSIDLVKDNFNGFIFKAHDKNDLEDKILKIIQNKTTFGSNSKLIIQNWTYKKGVDAIKNVLNEF